MFFKQIPGGLETYTHWNVFYSAHRGASWQRKFITTYFVGSALQVHNGISAYHTVHTNTISLPSSADDDRQKNRTIDLCVNHFMNIKSYHSKMYEGLTYRMGYYSISRRLIAKFVIRLYFGTRFNFLHKLFAGGGSFPEKLRVTKIVPIQPESSIDTLN